MSFKRDVKFLKRSKNIKKMTSGLEVIFFAYFPLVLPSLSSL